MAKELTDRQKQIRAKARKAAQAAGKDWGKASKEERRAFMLEARKTSNPVAARAKQAAEAAGKKWRELSPEERKAFRTAAREKA